MTKTMQRIEELAAMWVLVGTNEGTYGTAEACRAIGTGDPAFANCRIYERVGDGARRTEGLSADDAPGRIREFRGELASRQKELANLRKQR